MTPIEDMTNLDETILDYDATMREGHYLDAAAIRVLIWLQYFTEFPSFYGLALTTMGLGLIAGRRRLLENASKYARTWYGIGSVGLLTGLPLTAFGVWYIDQMWGYALVYASAPLLSVGYLGSFIWINQHVPRLLSVFESPGRMSLTCYILQSVVLCMIYHGYGLGYFGMHSLTYMTFVALLTAVGIAVIARLWLTYFSAGPLEYFVSRYSRLRNH
jgi:uncharacterized protein